MLKSNLLLRKIIFPVAGLGTRFLPATKASPKEMLTIVDKPLIQYGVEEALTAQLDHILMVTGSNKRAVEDHFDASTHLEQALLAAGKKELFKKTNDVSNMADVAYIRQKQALGLGHAVLRARDWIGNESFAVALADELLLSTPSALAQLRQVYDATGCSVIALGRVPKEDTHKYGIVDAVEEDGLLRLRGMVEKPKYEDAPSNLAIIGRYIFTPRLFALLADTKAGKQGEIQLTDAMQRLAVEEPMYGVVIDCDRFDAGNPLGFLQANIALGLRHPDYAVALRKFLKTQI
ncbi:MAG: UTP--glucose-1-phosphate uridylyltransferase GalU [Mariprofundales bacterium]